MSDGHRAQIAVLRAGVNVDHRLHVVVVHHRRTRLGADLNQVAQHLRALRAGAVTGVFIRSCMEVMRYCGACTAIW